MKSEKYESDYIPLRNLVFFLFCLYITCENRKKQRELNQL